MNEPVCEILFDTTRILQWKQSIGVVGLIGSDVTGLKSFTSFFFPQTALLSPPGSWQPGYSSRAWRSDTHVLMIFPQ